MINSEEMAASDGENDILVKVIFDYFVMLGKLLMLCGQEVEPMLVVCMMRQGPGG